MTDVIEIIPIPKWPRGCSPLGDARKHFDMDGRCEDCRAYTSDIRRKACKHCGRLVCLACRPTHGIKPPRGSIRGGKARAGFFY